MKIATIFNTPDTSWVELVTPYDPDFIDDLKQFISRENRKWVPDTTSWRVRVTEVKFLKKLLNDHGFVCTEQRIDVQPGWSQKGGNLFAQVLDMVPDEHVNKVYYALAQAVHPDHGGTSDQMKQLNMAYESRTKNGR
jgi:hypothetical protein